MLTNKLWWCECGKMSVAVCFVAGALLLLTRAGYAGAEVYVYRDGTGTVHYTNVPTRRAYRPMPRLGPRRPPPYRHLDTSAFDPLIRAACRLHRVEFALVKAVIKAESAFDPQALSPAGARGLMQLMPQTAAMHGVADLDHPHDNINGGVRHLRLLLDRYHGNLSLALAAYNAGAEAVDQHNGIPPFEETYTYVARVLRYREIYRTPAVRLLTINRLARLR